MPMATPAGRASTLWVIFLIATCVSCTTPPPVEGFVDGESRAVLAVDRATAFLAAQRVVAEMKLSDVISEERDNVSAINARYPDKTHATVRLTDAGAEQTLLTVRVAVLGDEQRSAALIDAVRAKLGQP